MEEYIMRFVSVRKDKDKFITTFYDGSKIIWNVESYLIMELEIMTAWIENGVHPVFKYR